MKTFNIIKKNRKYFAATKNGYKCKILIDDNSKDLESGKHTLEVDDISVRSKYGTDLIYKLSASITEQKDAGVCSLQVPFYNSVLVQKCRDLGGQWDTLAKAWVFSGIVADKIDELDEKYNSESVQLEIKFSEDFYADKEACELAGFTIATATGRDSGARLGKAVSMIEGKVRSGGSVKNWSTVVEKDTVIRMQIPKLVLDELKCDVKLVLNIL